MNTKIHFHTTISKSELLEKFVRMEQIHAVLLNQLNMELGISLQQNRVDENSGVDTGR